MGAGGGAAAEGLPFEVDDAVLGRDVRDLGHGVHRRRGRGPERRHDRHRTDAERAILLQRGPERRGIHAQVGVGRDPPVEALDELVEEGLPADRVEQVDDRQGLAPRPRGLRPDGDQVGAGLLRDLDDRVGGVALAGVLLDGEARLGEPPLGARPMKRTIARLLEAPPAERILRGELPRGAVLLANVELGQLELDVLDSARAPAAE